jgi:hypothetical protein
MMHFKILTVDVLVNNVQIRRTSNVQHSTFPLTGIPNLIDEYVHLTLDLGVAISDSGSVKPIPMRSLYLNVSLLLLLRNF